MNGNANRWLPPNIAHVLLEIFARLSRQKLYLTVHDWKYCPEGLIQVFTLRVLFHMYFI